MNTLAWAAQFAPVVRQEVVHGVVEEVTQMRYVGSPSVDRPRDIAKAVRAANRAEKKATSSPMSDPLEGMVVLSFDIGTKNFAYWRGRVAPKGSREHVAGIGIHLCGRVVITEVWELIDFVAHDLMPAIGKMHKWFDVHGERVLAGVTHVALEEQNDREKFCPRHMTKFAGAVVSEMIRHGVSPENIAFVPPSAKFAGVEKMPNQRDYNETNEASIARGRQKLVMDQRWLNYLEQFKERAHLTDSMLQGLYRMGLLYNKKGEMEAAYVKPETKKRRVSTKARPLIDSVPLDDLSRFLERPAPDPTNPNAPTSRVEETSKKAKPRRERRRDPHKRANEIRAATGVAGVIGATGVSIDVSDPLPPLKPLDSPVLSEYSDSE